MSTETALFNKFGNTIPPGTVIFKEGDEGECMHIIQKGRVKVCKNINSTEHILAILEKGDFFGETALVTKSKRTASIISLTEVELLTFDRAGFSSMIEKNAKIALNIIDKLCKRLQNANMQIQHLVKKNRKGLVALNLLYRFKEDEDLKLEYKKTTEEISLNLEIPLEDVKEILRYLAEEDIIELDNETLGLKEENMLRAEADRIV